MQNCIVYAGAVVAKQNAHISHPMISCEAQITNFHAIELHCSIIRSVDRAGPSCTTSRQSKRVKMECLLHFASKSCLLIFILGIE